MRRSKADDTPKQKAVSNLANGLSRGKIKHAKVIATYLLNQGLAWKRRHGETAFWFTSKTVKYNHANYPITKAQDDLVAAGYMTKIGKSGAESNQFVPTLKLMNYVDKFEAASKVRAVDDTQRLTDLEYELGRLASQAEIQQAQIKDHAQQIVDIWEAFSHVEQHNPPVTQEKIEHTLRLIQTEPEQSKPVKASSYW